jgi:hypothetical protein
MVAQRCFVLALTRFRRRNQDVDASARMAPGGIGSDLLALFRRNVGAAARPSIDGFHEFLVHVEHISRLCVESDDKANQLVIDLGDAHLVPLLSKPIVGVVGLDDI